jgi:phytoene/squalene synthetase
MKDLFDKVSVRCSRITTRAYSTSFSLGIRCLDNELRDPIYAIYGFVRFADEIVDTFHGYDRKELLERFREDTFRSLRDGISLNPILNCFQLTVHRYHIEDTLIDQFLKSMEMDLISKRHNQDSYEEYILGSAEVVGLMCLRVFCDHDGERFNRLKPYAMRLGAAFQKINFLRDLQADYVGLGRIYFPGVDIENFDESAKQLIEENIKADFDEGFKGIKQLPRSARFGVYVAYVYYLALFKKIQNTPIEIILRNRISIRKRHKARLLAYSFVKHQLNLI